MHVRCSDNLERARTVLGATPGTSAFVSGGTQNGPVWRDAFSCRASHTASHAAVRGRSSVGSGEAAQKRLLGFGSW